MKTPDRTPGPSLEEELQLQEDTVEPTILGAIRYVNGHFSFCTPEGLVYAGIGYNPEFDFENDLVESTTTSATYINKLSFVTNDLSEGSYLILAQATISGSLSSTGVAVMSQLNDTTTFGELSVTPGVALSEVQFVAHMIAESISGSQTIDIDYRKSAGGGSVSIKDAKIVIWKVSD
jgi:hypothetical protein